MVLRLAQRGAQRAGGTGLAAGLEAQATPEEEAPVRSGHRHVIQARLKKAGAAWLPDHADQIAHLRVLRANNQWLPLWNEPHLCLTAPARTHPLVNPVAAAPSDYYALNTCL